MSDCQLSAIGAALSIKVADIPAAAVTEFVRLGVASALIGLALSFTAAASVLSDSALLPPDVGAPALRAVPPAACGRCCPRLAPLRTAAPMDHVGS